MADERPTATRALPYLLVIAPDLGQLPEARRLMQQVGDAAGLSEDRAFDLQVVVSEACANAIEHAASGVEIAAYVLSDRVIVEITNDGVFQPGLYKDDASRRRGLGLPLMVSLADQVHVARLPGDKTQVALTFFMDERRGHADAGGSQGAGQPAAGEPPAQRVPGGPRTMSPGGSVAGAAVASARTRSGRVSRWAGLVLPALIIAMIVIGSLRIEAAYSPASVFTALNIVFLTLMSFFVSFVAARSFLAGRSLAVLLVGAGTLSLGLGAALAAVHAGGSGVDSIPAVYNTAALLAGLCHLAGTLGMTRPDRGRTRSREVYLSVSYLVIVVLVAVQSALVRDHLWPAHFVQGSGATTFGFAVVWVAAVLFAISAMVMSTSRARDRSEFNRWYALGLALIAVGLAGVSFQLKIGDPLNWLGRSSQYLGAIFILVAVLSSVRETGSWILPLERALRESEDRYRSLVDLSPDGILVHAGGHYVFANPAAARFFGARSPEEIVGKPVMELVHPDDREFAIRRMDMEYAGAVTPPLPSRFVRMDGSPFEVEVIGTKVDFGGSRAIQLVLRDMSERKQAEEVVKESEERLSYALKMSRTGAWDLDLSDHTAHRSLEHDRIFGYESLLPEWTYEMFLDHVVPEDRAMVDEKFQAAMATRGDWSFECRILRADGLVRWVWAAGRHRPDGAGGWRMAGVVQDITEGKQAEEALRKSEERLRVAMKNALVSAYEVDREQRYVWFHNPHPGVGTEDLTGRSAADIFSSPEVEKAIALRRRVMETGESVRQELTVPIYGETRDYDYTMEPVRNKNGEITGVLVAALDITERKRAEAALRQNEATFRAILDAATESIWLFSADGVVLAGNALAIDRIGKPADEVVGKRFAEILPPELAKARQERLEQVLESGRLIEFEDERAGRTFLHSFCPVSDDIGYVYGVASFSRDITERKRAEEALSKLNRTLKALSDGNQALVRSTDEASYVEEVCRIIVEDCGHAMVWIGYAENDERKTVRPVASAGFEQGYLESLRITWADSERGRGPTGTAIRTGKTCICRDMLTDPDFSPWREEAVKRGYGSSVTVPLIADGKAFGAVMIYSRQRDGFTEDEVGLLRELADDLALGITTLRLRAVHAAAEKDRERFIGQLQEVSDELAESNEELQSQAEELAAQSEELEVQNDELVLIQERLEESNRLSQALNKVNESLNSTLEFSEVLRRVVREGAFVLDAKKAVLELRKDDDWVVQEVLGLPEELRGLHLSDEEASVASAMRQCRDVLVIEDTLDDPRVNRSTVWRYGTSAALVVPVALRDRILGSLQFIWTGGPRTFAEPEVDFARKLTTSLAFALDNAQLHEQQKSIAQKLQQTLLDIPEQMSGVQFGHLYRSATEEASVGGDFYDVFGAKKGRIAVLIGDVCGHGVEAARVATLVKDVVHAFAHEFHEPSVVLAKTNELLLEKQTPGFVTLFLGALDAETGRFTYSSAGHPSALLRLKGGEVAPLATGSAPLGIFADYSWKESEIRLQRQELLLLYTDGAIEARQNGEFFGQEGLVTVLERWRETSPESLPAAILDEVMTFSGGVLTDDVALLALSLTEVGDGQDARSFGRQQEVAG